VSTKGSDKNRFQSETEDVPGRKTQVEPSSRAGAGPTLPRTLPRTTAEMGAWIQMRRAAKSEGEADAAPAAATEVAAAGVSGSGTQLPHIQAIQGAFGRHDVTDTTAHVGGAAADASAALGAQAYTTGNKVAFASQPDLHLAAHEAAHVVQQRAGVQLKSNVGEVGDAYERHADAVADAVVRGQSAEGLLDQMAGTGGTAAVQRKEDDEVGLADVFDAMVDHNPEMQVIRFPELTYSKQKKFFVQGSREHRLRLLATDIKPGLRERLLLSLENPSDSWDVLVDYTHKQGYSLLHGLDGSKVVELAGETRLDESLTYVFDKMTMASQAQAFKIMTPPQKAKCLWLRGSIEHGSYLLMICPERDFPEMYWMLGPEAGRNIYSYVPPHVKARIEKLGAPMSDDLAKHIAEYHERTKEKEKEAAANAAAAPQGVTGTVGEEVVDQAALMAELLKADPQKYAATESYSARRRMFANASNPVRMAYMKVEPDEEKKGKLIGAIEDNLERAQFLVAMARAGEGGYLRALDTEHLTALFWTEGLSPALVGEMLTYFDMWPQMRDLLVPAMSPPAVAAYLFKTKVEHPIWTLAQPDQHDLLGSTAQYLGPAGVAKVWDKCSDSNDMILLFLQIPDAQKLAYLSAAPNTRGQVMAEFGDHRCLELWKTLSKEDRETFYNMLPVGIAANIFETIQKIEAREKADEEAAAKEARRHRHRHH